MIVLVKQGTNEVELQKLIQQLEGYGVQVHPVIGVQTTILGLVGDTSVVDIDRVSSIDIVESVKRIQEPYKNANRKFHPADTVVEVNGLCLGR